MDESQQWQKWIEAHGPQLVLFARRWALNHAEAEDFVQDAFVRFWRTRQGVRDPLAYLYQCVRSVALDASRSDQSRKLREAHRSVCNQAVSYSASSVEDEERARRIQTALAELPTEQSEVVVLKIWSGLTFAQIAEVAGKSIGTVSSRYRYAIGRLRTILAESELA